MEINFIANDVVYEVTVDNSYLIGFADNKNEPNEYVIIERALEFDEQDIKLGMDSYYFEYSDQSNSGYGLCSKVILRQSGIVFSIKHKRMDDITSIIVSYKEHIIEDIKEYRKTLSNIFADILVIE
ncbi:Imm10 family immunity protein [Bacteroides sp.]|uniref:Imm10 family immunity protein n=1 Tax=Bacteroides sp. TaxID=29523 RepID=UPI003527F411